MFALVIGVILLMAEVTIGLKSGMSKTCSCAAMDSKHYEENKTFPLVEKSLNILANCGEEEALKCRKICVDLANITRMDPAGGSEFCKKVKKDLNNVHVSVFSKACDGKYQYTGLTFNDPTCCQKGERVNCKSA